MSLPLHPWGKSSQSRSGQRGGEKTLDHSGARTPTPLSSRSLPVIFKVRILLRVYNQNIQILPSTQQEQEQYEYIYKNINAKVSVEAEASSDDSK
jgi:hypothetical protein